MSKFSIVILACVAGLAGACSKSKEEQKGLPPAKNWQAPPSTAAAAAPADPANPHGAQPSDPHAGMGAMGGSNPHAGMDQQGMDVTATGLTPPDPNRQINPDKYLKGTIKPSAETKDVIPKAAVIFLSVKRADPKTGDGIGAPLAVKRLRLSTWPVWFQLTEEDAMVSGTQFDGEVVITAWADQDQDAISKMPGDVLGTVKAKVPSDNLVIELNTVLK